MFSRIRKRLTYANVAMTLALVFVMTGGAYAANKYLITSTKQISPKVLTSLKGKNGKNGTNGTPGATGPQGPAGPQGLAGTTGPSGKEGAEGKEGKTGSAGPEGSPWGKGVLPSGKTETGMWGAAGAGVIKQEQNSFPISFPVPLDEAPEAIFVGTQEESKPGCPGRGGIATAGIPMAEPGKLCVYAGQWDEAALNPFVTFGNEGGEWNFKVGTSPAGTFVRVKCLEGASPVECEASGTWAVTAE